MTPAIAWRRTDQTVPTLGDQHARANSHLLGEDLFWGALTRERKRAHRSDQPVLLALISLRQPLQADWQAIVKALGAVRRDTDVMGWFRQGTIAGLIVQDVPAGEAMLVSVINEQLSRELKRFLTPEALSRVSVKVQLHRDPYEEISIHDAPPSRPTAATPSRKRRASYEIAKRALDIAGSAALLILLSPVFLVIAVLVKLKSPGPVFFHQERIGQHMKPFRMLKFRTMYVKSDNAIHQQFVTSLINSGSSKPDSGVFKIVNDPRVTPIGKFLRRTSLDEIPQFWNVLRGDMSLVGPRPPVRYEVEQYKPWHRRRILESKPGVTGLWQVSGRSRTTFDEMVRLDLRYAKANSVWTDIKILLATPRAVISGKGAC